ncbi:MAG: hypothetical protein GXP62_09630, partial [Oligoflexia bacterium]|nr:hypothetical protein [Oligoflexia bacterium]
HIGGVDGDARLPGARPHPARWRDALLTGVFTGLAAWTYWFMGYFMALLFAWLGGVDLVRRGARKRRLLGFLVAAMAAAAVVGPGVLAMAGRVAAGAVPGLQRGASGALDQPAAVANNVSQQLHGYWLMETQGQPLFGYLVWGLLLFLAACVARDRARWVGAWLVVMAFAIGPVLQVGAGISMPHYLLAYHYLPFFDRLWFPVRMVAVAMLAASVLLGMLVDRLDALRRARLPRLPAAVVPVLLVVVGMVEQHRVLAFPLLARDFSPPEIYRVIGSERGGLIELPIGMARISIAWQAVHQQPTFGGMAENAPIFHPAGFRRRLANPFILYLRRVTRDPDRELGYAPAALGRLVSEGFRWVVLDRQLVDSEVMRTSFARRVPASVLDRAPFYVQDNISAHIGAPVMAEGRLVVWDLVGGAEVPPELVPTRADLTERTWPKKEMPAYESWMRASGRLSGMGPDRTAGQHRKAGQPPIVSPAARKDASP